MLINGLAHDKVNAGSSKMALGNQTERSNNSPLPESISYHEITPSPPHILRSHANPLTLDQMPFGIVLKEILKLQLQLVDGQLEKLTEVMEEQRNEKIITALESQDYAEAKQSYLETRDHFIKLRHTFSQQRIELMTPSIPLTLHGES